MIYCERIDGVLIYMSLSRSHTHIVGGRRRIKQQQQLRCQHMEVAVDFGWLQSLHCLEVKLPLSLSLSLPTIYPYLP